MFPPGVVVKMEGPKKPPQRTPAELAESLLRWRCKEYAPGFQCHLCDMCTVSNPRGLCRDLLDAVGFLAKLEQINEKVCPHGKLREECGPCKPVPPGSQD